MRATLKRLTMQANTFDGDDSAYLEWTRAHADGFVLNRRRSGQTARYLVLHRATCDSITRSRSDEPGEFTESEYVKVCAESLDALREYARAAGRTDGSFSLICKRCKPMV
ncbi:hypothetical protein SB783_38950 [Paraburkholderia sp. SIMBA_009]|uniref:hypothetical protein n=1 Tax=Paraburkholderia tropica TaxID=92647 RepID=UPI0016157E00|nr:hypothetical protein [Paraburkholderia tropica]MBB2984747.1 hypothetical protein [Paraburkholderia tropica]